MRLCLLQTVRDKGVFVCGKAISRMFHCLCIRKNKCSGKRSIIIKTLEKVSDFVGKYMAAIVIII